MSMRRRDFIRSAGLAAVGVSFGDRLLRGGVAQAAGERVIVVVNMEGGNDGLNTVIPMVDYDRYRALRGRLALDAANVLPLSGVPDLALNPGLASFQNLYAQGKLAVINGVAVPHGAAGKFDHSAQQTEFQTCDIVNDSSATQQATGWLGRYLDPFAGGVGVPPAIDLGGGRLMLTGSACDPLTIKSISDLQVKVSFDSSTRMPAYRNIMSFPNADPVASRNRVLRLNALDQSDTIRAATASYSAMAAYPADSRLSFSLQQCAKLIYADLGIRALSVGIGGFDTHDGENQGNYHDNLLREVADSVAAFYADLDGHGLANRVLILTMSEFGRTAYANGSVGTDHGYSSVSFALGGAVKGGVYGQYPSLASNRLVFGGLTDIVTDFRSVYATALANFAGVDPTPIVGGTFPLLGYL
jgi:uncharacterized protein (DUF1501 family)